MKTLKTLLLILTIVILAFNFLSIKAEASGIDDQINVLQSYDKMDLQSFVMDANKHKYDLFFVITNDNVSSSYVDRYFQEHAEHKSGAVVVISESQQQVYISVYGELENYFSSSQLYKHETSLTELLVYDTHYEALSSAGQYITSTINAEGVVFDTHKNISWIRVLLPTTTSIAIGVIVTAIIVVVVVVKHNSACKKVKAKAYLDNTFEIQNRDDIYMGERIERIPNYYKKRN